MTDQKRTLQSMTAVSGNGNGQHEEDELPPQTDHDPLSQMKTPPGGLPLAEFMGLKGDHRDAYIHSEIAAFRIEFTRQGASHASRDREVSLELRQLGRNIEVALKDAHLDRVAAERDRAETQKQYGEIKLQLDGHDRAFDQIDKDIAELGRITGDEAKKTEDRHHLVMESLKGLKTQLGENNVDIRRVNGRITMLDGRFDEVVLAQQAARVSLEALNEEIGTVPHVVDAGTSLIDRTPEAAKKREENAKQGTGIKGQLARHDKNVVTLSAKSAAWLALGGAGGSGLIKIGEVYGAEYSALIVAGGALVTSLGFGVKRVVERAKEALQARRIKVTPVPSLPPEDAKRGGPFRSVPPAPIPPPPPKDNQS
jgi:hypothetical protein